MKATRYQPDEMVFPSLRDESLWETIYEALVEEYSSARVLRPHARWAYETVCQSCDKDVRFNDFLRKVRLTWLWKRPALPRGMLGEE